MPIEESERVSLLLKRIHEGPAWHGPSLREVLEGVDARAASRRPFPNVHTIWELVLHLTAWLDIFYMRVGQGLHLEVTSAMDWPRMPSFHEDQWQATLSKLWEAENRVAKIAREIPTDRYGEMVEGDTPTPLYEVLSGLVAHTAYHAGQIAILKKL